uniref:Collagen alpha-1(I) chain-like n=1 Tax=Phascolarctos cinereus TaxID=38626 RepID=A0A6P5LPA8_PHACI|nr:collagen alpha-1(I) chain-like [Phascolarctos cinereus]
MLGIGGRGRCSALWENPRTFPSFLAPAPAARSRVLRRTGWGSLGLALLGGDIIASAPSGATPPKYVHWSAPPPPPAHPAEGRVPRARRAQYCPPIGSSSPSVRRLLKGPRPRECREGAAGFWGERGGAGEGAAAASRGSPSRGPETETATQRQRDAETQRQRRPGSESRREGGNEGGETARPRAGEGGKAGRQEGGGPSRPPRGSRHPRPRRSPSAAARSGKRRSPGDPGVLAPRRPAGTPASRPPRRTAGTQESRHPAGTRAGVPSCSDILQGSRHPGLPNIPQGPRQASLLAPVFLRDQGVQASLGPRRDPDISDSPESSGTQTSAPPHPFGEPVVPSPSLRCIAPSLPSFPSPGPMSPGFPPGRTRLIHLRPSLASGPILEPRLRPLGGIIWLVTGSGLRPSLGAVHGETGLPRPSGPPFPSSSRSLGLPWAIQYLEV